MLFYLKSLKAIIFIAEGTVGVRVCVCACARMIHLYRSENSLQESIPSLYHVGPWDRPQVVGLGSKQPYCLDHLTSPLLESLDSTPHFASPVLRLQIRTAVRSSAEGSTSQLRGKCSTNRATSPASSLTNF